MPSSTPAPVSLHDALRSARDTRALLLGSGVLARVPAVFREHFPDGRAVVVADPTTLAVAGRTVRDALVAAGLEGEPPFVFTDPGLYAENRFVDQLEAALKLHRAIPVAVGSGTINDLTKLAAHRCGRPYLCVATAASMDGYAAYGASITIDGSKQTVDCPAPRAIVADSDIICRAPAEMTAAGYADLMAKVTAGADWILADTLGVEPIEARAWAIVQGGLRGALADPAGARAGRASAIEPLVEGLMLGGFAMQVMGASRPASGAEHQFSHLWDMEHHVHQGAAPAHGFKVGVATMAVTALYEWLLRQPIEQLDLECCVTAWPERAAAEAATRRLFSADEFVETPVKETLAKHVTRDGLRVQLEQLRRAWPATRAHLREQLLPIDELRRRLRAVGAPVEPEEIGITRLRLRQSFVRAQHLRRRFTVLDVAVRLGLLEPALDTLFGPGGPWAITP